MFCLTTRSFKWHLMTRGSNLQLLSRCCNLYIARRSQMWIYWVVRSSTRHRQPEIGTERRFFLYIYILKVFAVIESDTHISALGDCASDFISSDSDRFSTDRWAARRRTESWRKSAGELLEKRNYFFFLPSYPTFFWERGWETTSRSCILK